MVFDEDHDERRREKFSRERGVGGGGGGQDYRRPFERPKRDYPTNGSAGGGIVGGAVKRAYRGGGEEEQPVKRGRFDSAAESFEPVFNRRESESNVGATSTLLTFKKFLMTQDESLSDEEAIAKYNEYKTDFLHKEFERYFQSHKEEEWFRSKYHPEEGRARREEHRANIRNRLAIFNEFRETGRFKDISLSADKAEQIIRLMDAVVVKLEGGSDADIEAIKDEQIEDESVQELKILGTAPKGDIPSAANGRRASLEMAANESFAKKNEMIKSLKTSDEEGGTTTAEDATTTEAMDQSEEKTSLIVPIKQQQDQQPKGRQPHKTCSIFLRSVPVAASYTDLENLCKQHPGFLRLAIDDPLPDSRGNRTRSAWVTYRRDVNIKEIFWPLRGAKLLATDLGAVVNRDLKRRIRVSLDSSSSPTSVLLDSHRPVAANALRQAARLIVLLDAREGIYREEMEAEEGEEEGGAGGDSGNGGGASGDEIVTSKLMADVDGAVLRSLNPVLLGIGDYMVEECSAEEDALLAQVAATAADDGSPMEITHQLEEDRNLIQVLDRLILYLRIVHSVDLYGVIQYQQEDQMPNRLGVIHVRGVPATKSNRAPQLAKGSIDAYIKKFNERLENALIKKCTPVPEQELQKLGKKNAEKAVEEFIEANTQQIGPDKWLCPLSGKKFKGPEFVQKHITSKHKEDVDKVRYEALYFNNYISDPNRPHNPQLFATATNEANKSTRDRRPSAGERPRSPVPLRERVDHGGGPMEVQERIPYQRHQWGYGGGGNDRYSVGGGGGGPARYVGGGRPTFGGGGGGWRAPPGRMEPMNETSMRSSGGGGPRDPRAPASYKDLDAPTDDII